MKKHIEKRNAIGFTLVAIGALLFNIQSANARTAALDLEPNAAVDKQHRDAYIKYRMARMALQDNDIKLANQFFHEALAANPKNGALRYEYASFLAKNGKGEEALTTLEPFQGGLELTAKVEYLKAKINIASELDGKYIETSKTQTIKGKGIKQLQADGLFIISLGQVTWGQRIRTKVVTQKFSFPVHQLKSEATSYEIDLTWEGIEKNDMNYTSDKINPKLKAQRTKLGWNFTLQFEDENGGLGTVTFTPQKVKKKKSE